MEPNVGGWDRRLRLIVGPLLVVAGIVSFGSEIGPLSSSLTAGVAIVGGIALTLNGLTRRCGMNALLGIDTCPRTQ